MDIDADGSLGRAMSQSYAEQQGKDAMTYAKTLEARIANLEEQVRVLSGKPSLAYMQQNPGQFQN